MSQVNDHLLELFRSHGVVSSLQGEWISFPQRDLRANASTVREIEQQNGMLVQIDVRFEIASGRTILESFAGLGETTEQAVSDAIHNFAANSFHVLLAAFLRPNDEQVSQVDWLIDGKNRRVTVGNIGIRGKPPVREEQLVGWCKRFEQKLMEQHFEPATHWVRLYYAQSQSKATACEVMLDNEVWQAMQYEAAALDWPPGEGFYSVRIFLVIHGENGGIITPERAVARLVEIIAASPDLTEELVYIQLADTGIPDAIVDRAYKFTQIAWGRLLLDGMGIGLSDNYVCFDSEGTIVETDRLVTEPYYAAASQLGTRYASTQAFQRIALTSADVHAVNNALNAGSKPEDLVMAPAFVFIDEPTPTGLQNAKKIIAQYEASLGGENAPRGDAFKARPRRPWWHRFRS